VTSSIHAGEPTGSSAPPRPTANSIRRADGGDAAGILGCLHAAFEPYRGQYPPAAFEDTVLTPERLEQRMAAMAVFVAVTAGGEVIGTVACHTRGGGEDHLRGMAVRPECQGCGAAAHLLAAAETELRRAGCHRVSLGTTRPLARAARFYEAHGYRQTGAVSDFFGMELIEYERTLDGGSGPDRRRTSSGVPSHRPGGDPT
jgi:GNAT superfamily N-acetyltransferase